LWMWSRMTVQIVRLRIKPLCPLFQARRCI